MQLFGENLIRGRGLFVRSCMRAQASSLPFTPVFASLVAIINTKLPQIGELLLHRLVHQFRRSYKRNDKVGAWFTAPCASLFKLTSAAASTAHYDRNDYLHRSALQPAGRT